MACVYCNESNCNCTCLQDKTLEELKLVNEQLEILCTILTDIQTMLRNKQ